LRLLRDHPASFRPLEQLKSSTGIRQRPDSISQPDVATLISAVSD
jgi:hypothetical protein